MPDADFSRRWRFCVAPMLDWTDTHCRVFHRSLSRHARLYTEMITSPALVHGNRDRLLRRSEVEHPPARQLGGSDPAELAQAAKWVAERGYDEVNLNCGCPSERVQRGSFGACLMLEPKLVADCFKAMRDAVDIDVTVKHRIGVDKEDSYGFVRDFVGTLFDAGCRVFIVHTRAAWLKGLSPKENREVPPLKRDYAATQKRDEFRLRGDLITANLYRMKSGEKVLHAENYYEDGCPAIDIPLDPLLSPQQNAAKNYKQYNKLKTAEFHLREQIEKAENERAYLESVLQELSQAETEQEFNEIRRELQETNYLKKSSGGKKELKRAFAPRTFKTSSGLEVLVGRSNVQNDQLTKKADKRDYWFHTQHIHGSHVILRCAGLTPSDEDLREAAMLASYFSQAKESSSVPVDYCPVKFVKKPAGARPGMVTYDNYRTLYVTPEEGLAKKLFLR